MQVLAHRGAPGPGRSENSAGAVEAALMAGASGVEVDVRVSADGRVVCVHDSDLTRVAGSPLAVGGSSASTLRRVPLGAGDRIALLDEIASIVRGRGRLVVEMKAGEPRLPAAVAGVLARHHGLEVVVSSFDPLLLAGLRGPGPEIRRALLGTRRHKVEALLRQALDEGYAEIHPHVRALDRPVPLVRMAHRLGVAVVPWAVNRRGDLLRCAEAPVDGVITDHVGAAAQLTRWPGITRSLPRSSSGVGSGR